jgi:hypothetical protein
MAFKHIRSIINEASTDQTLYTVPAGKEFVLLRTRARYEGEPSSGDDSGDITASNGTQDFAEINGALNEAGTTTVNGVTAPYYSKTVGNNEYYVTRAYSSFQDAVVWAITAYDLSSEATHWEPNTDDGSMAYVISNASSPVGLTFTASSYKTGTPPTFSSAGMPPAQISYEGYDMFSDMSGTASLTTNFTYEGRTYDYCYALSNGYYIVYPYDFGNGNEWALYGWAGNGSSVTPVGRYTAPNGSYIDVADAGGSGGGYVSDGTFHYGQTPSFFISSSALPSPESTYYAGVFEYDAQSGKYLGRRGASAGAYLNYSNGYFYFGYNGSATRECYTTEANFFGTNTFNGAGSGGIGGKTITIQEEIPFNFNYDDNPSFTVTESSIPSLVGTYSFSLGTAWRYFKDDDNTISLYWDGSTILSFMQGNNMICSQTFQNQSSMESGVYGTHTWSYTESITIVRGVASSGGGSGTGNSVSVSFKVNSSNAFETIDIGSNAVAKGQAWKTLYEAGTLIKVNATVADAMAEIMGLELKAGTWESVGGNGGGSSSSAWGGSNTVTASGFASIAIPGSGFITSPNGTYTYNASTDRYEYADSGDDVLFYINNTHDMVNGNEVYYQLRYRSPKTGTVESDNIAYGQTSQTFTSQGTWYDVQGQMQLDQDAVVTV